MGRLGLKSYLTVNNIIQFYNKNCTTFSAEKQVEVNFMARKIRICINDQVFISKVVLSFWGYFLIVT